MSDTSDKVIKTAVKTAVVVAVANVALDTRVGKEIKYFYIPGIIIVGVALFAAGSMGASDTVGMMIMLGAPILVVALIAGVICLNAPPNPSLIATPTTPPGTPPVPTTPGVSPVAPAPVANMSRKAMEYRLSKMPPVPTTPGISPYAPGQPYTLGKNGYAKTGYFKNGQKAYTPRTKDMGTLRIYKMQKTCLDNGNTRITYNIIAENYQKVDCSSGIAHATTMEELTAQFKHIFPDVDYSQAVNENDPIMSFI